MITKRMDVLVFIILLGFLPAKSFSMDKGLSDKNIFLNDLSINERIESGYLRIVEENQETTSEAGMPELPIYSTLYMVDPLKDYEFELIVHDSYIMENIEVYPFQNDTDNSFIKNEPFYTSNQEYPENNLSVSDRIQARNMQLISVSVVPFSYNPNMNKLEVFTNIEIVINELDSNSDREPINIKRSKLFEQLYGDMIVNFEPSNRDEDYQHPAILYICGGNSCNNSYVQQLVEWRHQQGYIVYTATESQVGGSSASTSEIKNYIEDAVETWENPPIIVGLIGDTNGNYGLPCNYHEWGSGWYGYNGATDFDYTQLNGNDLLSDVLIGRISASNSSHLDNIISKTIQYEKAQYQSSDWFEGAALVGDPSSGTGQSAIITNQYIENIMENFGFQDIDTNYGQGNYDNWVEDRFDEGILYYNYRGFYGSSGIGESGFNNGYETPFVTTLTCGTGDFDGTSDSENFIRTGSVSNPSGAVAAVGVSTLGTHTAYNNIVDMGIYDGIFSKQVDYVSAAMTSGHLAIYNTYPSNPGYATETFISWSNLMGDPALHLWTDTPSDFIVTYPTSIDQGTTNLNIIIEDGHGPVENAIATILKGNDIIFESKLSSTNGHVNFNWNNNNSTEDIILTIRKKNYRPFQESITTSSSSAYLSIETSSVSVDGDGYPNPGETIELTIPITNFENSSVSNVMGNLSTNSEYIDIVDGNASYGNISAGQTSSNGVFTLEISANAVDMENLELNLNILSSDGANINCNVPLFVQGALIEPLSSSTNLISETINIVITNNGSLSADNLNIELSSNNDMISITSPSQSINSLNPGESETIVYDFSTTGYFVPGSVISLPLDISSSDGYHRLEYINPTFGSVSVTDPFGPDEYGYYIFDSNDSGYLLSPNYEWIEIADGLGEDLNLDDDGNGNGSNRTTFKLLPFDNDFNFYGISYDEITISADGWISFDRHDVPSFRNHPIPGAGGPSPMVAAFWDDLKTGSEGDVFYQQFPLGCTHDCDYVVIQWDSMRTYDNNSSETFEIILYNNEDEPTLTGDNEIKIQYYDFNNTSNGYYPEGGTPTHGCYATIGIENHLANQGLQYSFNNQYPVAAMSLSDGDALFISTGRVSYTPGDINQDEDINVLDVVTLVNIILNIINPTPIQEMAADVNGDGTLNVLDVVLIVNLVLGD